MRKDKLTPTQPVRRKEKISPVAMMINKFDNLSSCNKRKYETDNDDNKNIEPPSSTKRTVKNIIKQLDDGEDNNKLKSQIKKREQKDEDNKLLEKNIYPYQPKPIPQTKPIKTNKNIKTYKTTPKKYTKHLKTKNTNQQKITNWLEKGEKEKEKKLMMMKIEDNKVVREENKPTNVITESRRLISSSTEIKKKSAKAFRHQIHVNEVSTSVDNKNSASNSVDNTTNSNSSMIRTKLPTLSHVKIARTAKSGSLKPILEGKLKTKTIKEMLTFYQGKNKSLTDSRNKSPRDNLHFHDNSLNKPGCDSDSLVKVIQPKHEHSLDTGYRHLTSRENIRKASTSSEAAAK